MTIKRRKKNRTDTFITPSDTAAGKRPFLFYYYYIHFFFYYSTHAGDDCYNSNAPFAFLQPLRVRPRALLSFGRHFAGAVHFIILILY